MKQLSKNQLKKFISKNRSIDNSLYDQLKKLNVVKSMDSLSVLFGRTTSYYRSMKAKRLGLKLASLTMLREQLSVRMEMADDPQQSVIYGYGMKAVEQAIRSKILLQQGNIKSSKLHNRGRIDR
jgi:hypothetical protein